MKVLLPVKQEYSESDDDNSCYSSSNSNSDYADDSNRSDSKKRSVTKFLSFTNLEGVHTGVPTRTTSTLTPTTLRIFEEDWFELPRDSDRSEPHHNEAGFVPPPVDPASQGKNTFLNFVDKSGFGGYTTITTTPAMNRLVVSSTPQIPLLQAAPQQTRRNMGGRRPTKNTGISPEEEERRKVRRERNKLAAARCRKRRVDHTNELLMETDGLEQKRQQLQSDIQQLQLQKEHLEFLLDAHKVNCRLIGSEESPPSPPELKPLVFSESRIVSQAQPRCDAATLSSSQAAPRRPQLGATAGTAKPSRPSSLPVAAKPIEIAGVPITTPSSVIPFNFESLMDGGTGLTPVSSTGLSPMVPSCSSQQRNTAVDLASPETSCPPKLVSL